jgi:HD-GYP domain-containing protein (c-di-GMP phosphodiesterase class II)
MLESHGGEQIAEWVLHHHERWDGAGYPAGLEGDEIPLGARIILVADAFDAMTNDRVYRSKLSIEDALAEIEAASGTQFAPEAVEALLEEYAPVEARLAS